jgi:putative FmdB family regulatory protein
MPIYAYKCSTCGHAKDVLQKISDAPLTDCPECGASTFSKQVTAAGFQLKGSGWYVTDFRNNGNGGGNAANANGGKSGKEEGTAPATGAAAGSGDGAAAKGGEAKSSGAAATPAATPAPAAASTPSAS